MKKRIIIMLAVLVMLSACSQAATPTTAPAPTEQLVVKATSISNPTATAQPTKRPTETAVPATKTPTAVPTAVFPVEGRGPTNFAAGVNPLTGLEAANPQLLERRPIVIKVENIPREHRPQWGLSLADLVFEYYTEMGSTRFAAIYYGQDSQVVGPIRSGRFFDSNLVEMYKGIFVFGSAYEDVRNRFFESSFASRLIIETPNSCPAVCRYDPYGQNLLVADTAALQEYVKTRSVDNSRQNLDGMFFQLQAPAGGQDAEQVYVRFSGAIYNRWDYDPGTGSYLRFAETQNDINRNNEAYAQLTDRQTSQPIAADNVVMLCALHRDYVRTQEMEVLEILMDPKGGSYTGCDGNVYQGGTGAGYIARDGKIYPVTWKREKNDSVLTLVNPDGTLFPFKPGQTWFEVVGSNTRVDQQESAWRFNHVMR